MKNYEKPTKWKTKNGFISIQEMSSEHLQKAFLFAQQKELRLHNASLRYAHVSESLYDEALKRGIKLKYPDEMQGAEFDGYYANNRKYWEQKKEVPKELPTVHLPKESKE